MFVSTVSRLLCRRLTRSMPKLTCVPKPQNKVNFIQHCIGSLSFSSFFERALQSTIFSSAEIPRYGPHKALIVLKFYFAIPRLAMTMAWRWLVQQSRGLVEYLPTFQESNRYCNLAFHVSFSYFLQHQISFHCQCTDFFLLFPFNFV